MLKLFKALLLGLAAGIIEVIPMVFRELPWHTDLAMLIHWLCLGVIITYARFSTLSNWASGATIALLTAIPIATLNFPHDPLSVIPIIVFSGVLGGLLGYTSDRLINTQP